MPEPNGPHSLASWSLLSLAQWAVEASTNILENDDITEEQKWENINQTVRKYTLQLHPIFANRFVAIISALLRYSKHKKILKSISHPECTTLSVVGMSPSKLPWSEIHLENLPKLAVLVISSDCSCPNCGNKNIDSECLQLLFPSDCSKNSFNLQYIEVPNGCTYKLLLSISQHCPLLTKLVITNCVWKKGEIRCLANCKNLAELDCGKHHDEADVDTWLNKDIAYLIAELRRLRDVGFYNLYHVLKHLDKTRQYSLKYASFYFVHDTDFSKFSEMFPGIYALASYTPLGPQIMNLQKLQMTFLELQEETCDDLILYFEDASKKLRELSLKNIQDIGRLFRRVQFNSLSDLIFYFCHELDVVDISKSAPNISHLNFENCSAVPLTAEHETSGFPNLTILCIYGSFSGDHLRFLLGSCRHLEDLRLENITWPYASSNQKEILTDNVFLASVHCDELNDLSHLYIRSNLLTKKTVKHVFKYCDGLRDFTLRGNQWRKELCDNVEGTNVLLNVQNFNIKFSVHSDNFVYKWDSTVKIENEKKILSRWSNRSCK